MKQRAIAGMSSRVVCLTPARRIGAALLLATLFVTPPAMAQEAMHGDHPNWVERGSYIEGDDFFAVGVASNVSSLEEGRSKAFENARLEVANFLGDLQVPASALKPQLVFDEKAENGRFNVFRLIKIETKQLPKSATLVKTAAKPYSDADILAHIRHFKVAAAFRDYLKASPNRAFAYSLSGHYAWRTGTVMAEDAAALALSACGRQRQLNEPPCQLIHANEQWLTPTLTSEPVLKTADGAVLKALRHVKALQAYQEQYLQQPAPKAFAYSADGPFGLAVAAASADAARNDALAHCEQKNKPLLKSCQVVNVDEQWQ